jgi:hypothetical protein
MVLMLLSWVFGEVDDGGWMVEEIVKKELPRFSIVRASGAPTYLACELRGSENHLTLLLELV